MKLPIKPSLILWFLLGAHVAIAVLLGGAPFFTGLSSTVTKHAAYQQQLAQFGVQIEKETDVEKLRRLASTSHRMVVLHSESEGRLFHYFSRALRWCALVQLATAGFVGVVIGLGAQQPKHGQQN